MQSPSTRRRALAILAAGLLWAGCTLAVQAQQEGLLQLDDPIHQFLLRQQAAGRLPHAHLTHLPLSTYEARRYLDSLSLQSEAFSSTDRRLLARFRGDQPGPGVGLVRGRLPFLYRNGQSFFSVEGDDFALELNPLLYLSYGRARQIVRDVRAPAVTSWRNTRGVRAAGHIGNYLFFEARLEETQTRLPQPEPVRFSAPRLGFVRINADSTVYDYQVATGILGLRTKFFEIRAGRDRNHWGFGRTSLSLSDYAPVYDHLQLRTTFWRLQYVNLYAVLTDLSSPPLLLPNEAFPRRYGAFHHLTLHVSPKLQVAFFEGVVFADDTTAARHRTGYDLAYLNPLIVYRAVEADRGSPDNVVLGAGLSWLVLDGLRFYTELLIDELTVSQIGKSWWGNKWGWTAGAQVQAFVPGLSLQVEYARLRPYLYSHMRIQNAYLHYGDVLGHPAGPNAEDLALFLNYQPLPRIHIGLNTAYTRRGRNTSDANYGADPRQSYVTRVSDTEVRLLQGVRQTQVLMESRLSYELLPDYFLTAGLQINATNDAETGMDRYMLLFLLVRWGLPFQSARY